MKQFENTIRLHKSELIELILQLRMHNKHKFLDSI